MLSSTIMNPVMAFPFLNIESLLEGFDDIFDEEVVYG